VKSVLGEFSSGVSVCRNNGTQSDVRAHFLPGAPRPGVTGCPSSGSDCTARCQLFSVFHGNLDK